MRHIIRNPREPQPLEVKIVNTSTTVPVEGGVTAGDIARACGLPFEAICCRVNNKTEGLDYRVYGPKTIEFLGLEAASGRRAYLRSLCLVMYRAVRTCCPGARLKIEHSVAGGYLCLLPGVAVTAELCAHIKATMQRIVTADLPIVPHRLPTPDVIRIMEREGLDDKVLLLKSSPHPYTTYVTLDDTVDSYYGCLVQRTGLLRVWDLEPYKDGMLLRSFDTSVPARVAPRRDQEKMYRAFTDHLAFNKIIGVSNVGELNAATLSRHAADLINVAEALHDKRLSKISDDITARYHRGGARIVLLAGPSSSGKTTTTKRLAIQLMTNLLKPVLISLDDYFVNREDTPRDADGDYDYESLYALDLKQFNDDLTALLDGREVELPSYSFELGRRVYKGNRVRLDPGSILLIEGIHGLNPELTAHIPEDQKYRVYVSALTTLSIDDHSWIPTTDNRLLRRIVRDSKYRGTDAAQTIRRWPSVRRGEEKWIFPYQENADAMFNSSLLFELAVIKDYATGVLERVRPSQPEYAQAYRLRKFLSYFKQIGLENIPPTSLLREFVGGSSFHY